MIRLTEAAAKQIRESARQGKTEGMALRVAVTKKADGSFHYAMGFDDTGISGDESFQSEGIEIVVSNDSLPLLEDTTIDFVELEGGEFNFIFLNPKDPNFQPPTDQGTA